MTIPTPTTETDPSTSGDYLMAMRDFAMTRGINAQTLLQDSQLSLAELINPPLRINSTNLAYVSRNFFNAINEPFTAAVEFGLQLDISKHGVLGIAAQNGSTIREVYKIIAQYFTTRSSSQNVDLQEDESYLTMRLITQHTLGNERIRTLIDLSTLVSIVNCEGHLVESIKATHQAQLSGPQHPVIKINYRQPENFPFHLLENLATVEFDCDEVALCLPMSWMDLPLPKLNPELTSAAIDQCEDELKKLNPDDLLSEIRLRLTQDTANTPSLDELARQLFMSTSTLKRRLKELQTSYQDIKDEVRFERARQLLQQGQSAEATALQLGFSDASNFNKAFKKWSGLTPKRFQQEQVH